MFKTMRSATRAAWLTFLLVGVFVSFSGQPAQATHGPAHDGNSVLILDDTVTSGAFGREAVLAGANGFTVEVASPASWTTRTAADFATYRAIILGDATCGGTLATAESNRAVWGPAINGNVVIVGTDPVFHQGQGGDQVTESGIKFAADEPTKTGAYITLSCHYHGTAPGTPVPVLDQFGSFTVTGVGCYNDAHIVASHPALTGLTDASLSNWSCSVHEAFDSFPSNFLPLAIAENISGSGSLTFGDGTFGIPYIIARGEELVPAACGDGNLDPGEECDDGNTQNGDGCSAQCKIEVVSNNPPDCSTAVASPSTIWPPNHKMVSVSITGVTDPDANPVTITPTAVTQDEAVKATGAGSGNTSPDATLSPLQVRAERNGNPKTPGNGRVYHISFTADDGNGGSCSGTVAVCVPHDQRPGAGCVDGGPLYNSLLP